MKPTPLITIKKYVLPTGDLLPEFSLRPGDISWIVGSNGSGKSSLLKWMQAGVIKRSIPKREQTAREGFDAIGQMTCRDDLSPETLAYLPQGDNLNIGLPLTIGDVLNLGACKQQPFKSITALCQDLDHSRPWNSASGGEKKKVILSLVASMASKKLILLDEPSNHLDKKARTYLGNWFLDFAATGGAMMIVSHDAPESFGLSASQIQQVIRLGPIDEAMEQY